MTEPTDRRVQLRESIHQLVVYWSERRGITPAAFVSVAIYEYLRTCGELGVAPEVSTKPPAATKVKPGEYVYDPSKVAVATDWKGTPDFSHLNPKPAPKPSPWVDDEEDDTEDYERAKMPSTITKVTPPENLTSLVETWPDAGDEE